jgi:flagellar basal-body rod protein FlgB
MFENLDVFKISHAMAKHAGQRQAILAQNVANADTPGYGARDIASFKSTYSQADSPNLQRATRSNHIHGVRQDGSVSSHEVKTMASPDGNTVSVETEIMKSTEAQRQHSRALAIYKSSLNILRSSLGRT